MLYGHSCPAANLSGPDTAEAPAPPEPTIPLPLLAQLGAPPDWSQLDTYQRTITIDEFRHLLDHCYARKSVDYQDFIQIWPDRARIRRQSNHSEAGFYDLYFLSDRRKPVTIDRYWKTPWQLPALPANEHRPLLGVHIALDPGHIGGKWANEEQRYYKIGEDTIPVQEGDLTLQTAKLLEKNLVALGARVTLTRRALEPVTHLRPDDLAADARAWLVQRNNLPSEALIKKTAERLFYVSSELRTRAEILNTEIKPDLVLCLHFNASPWRNPYRPAFRSINNLHLLVNGCYSRSEIAEDDTRLEMLQRLLQRTYYYELALADEISKTMADETRLPSMGYDGNSGKSVNDNPYVWARNLLANRKFLCPVVFFEPYCMNHKEVHARIQAGPYRGLREFNGTYRKNIYQEYADGATAGIVNYFRRVR
ncbi:MAG: N-acetylmuramoyl-L-alanine amidase [Verrucomicrobiae bacterium]|nr:N-acetylmuramoyl-L-alanine amidase [Verrucomicrobiae bacterium]